MKKVYQKRIGDICLSVCSGGTPKSNNNEYYDGNIPWLTTSEVNFNRIYDTEKKITEEGLAKSSAKIIPINSVIVAMYGVTAGRVAINKIELSTNQACCNLQINSKLADYRYIYYFLLMQSKELNSLANGSAQQNLNSILIKKHKILLPKIDEQEKIALLLEKYDDLIENNSRRIKLLENMAEEIYKEWFVRFRFPKYNKTMFVNNIPKEWKHGRLEELINFRRGKNITSDEMIPGDVIVISAGIEPSGFHNESNVKGRCITISASGANAGYLRYNILNVWAADCSYGQSDKYFWFIYNMLNYNRLILTNMQRGSAQPHVYATTVNKMKIIIPTEELMDLYDKKVEPIYEKIEILKAENNNLAIQRDLLLPRLMSGKIDLINKEIV